MKQPKFSVKRLIEARRNSKIVRIAPMCGTAQAGGIFCFSAFRDTLFVVVGQDAYYKYGSAQLAVWNGEDCQDYRTFLTAKAAVEYANALLSELVKAQKAHTKKSKKSESVKSR